MQSIQFIFFLLGAFLLFGMIRYFVALHSPGIYPPKKVLKKRVVSLGGAGSFFIFIGIIITILSK